LQVWNGEKLTLSIMPGLFQANDLILPISETFMDLLNDAKLVAR